MAQALRKRIDPKAPWDTVITEEQRASARQLVEQARGEAAAARGSRRVPEEEERATPVAQAITTRHRVPERNARMDKFVELMTKRMPELLTAMDNVRFLFSRERYDYTDKMAARVVEAIESKLAHIQRDIAEGGKRKPRETFEFEADDFSG